jgi:hypothetical protein
MKKLIPDADFITQCLLQPLPAVYGQSSARNGGNIMGFEEQPYNGILWVAIVLVKTAEQYAKVHPMVAAFHDALKAFAGTIQGGNLPWIYLNYADGSQDPLGSYGKDSVERIRQVAAKYDPGKVFQDLCLGGFKIPKTAGSV